MSVQSGDKLGLMLINFLRYVTRCNGKGLMKTTLQLNTIFICSKLDMQETTVS